MVITHLLNEVRYYPAGSIGIVGLFIIVTFLPCAAVTVRYKTRYGQVWQKKQLTSWEHRFHHWKAGWKC